MTWAQLLCHPFIEGKLKIIDDKENLSNASESSHKNVEKPGGSSLEGTSAQCIKDVELSFEEKYD